MNRLDLELLQKERGYPAVTVTMPTNRTFPENRQDPVRLKNLVGQAVDRLMKEFGKRQIAGVLRNLNEAADSVDHNMNLDGMAVFANSSMYRVFHLPFALRERVVVDETFLTRDLVFALNRSARYWLLVLSEKPTRLYEGFRDTLSEVRDGSFPMEHTGPGGATSLPGGRGVSRSAFRDQRHRQFFMTVASSLAGYAAAEPLPLFVTGVDKFVSMFRDQSSVPVRGALKGSHDGTPVHDLGAMVWPLVEEHLAGIRQSRIDELSRAAGADRVLATLGGIWAASHEGRGKVLLVEEGFHCPATVDGTGMGVTPSDSPGSPGVIDDAVDEIIEAVIAGKGEVVFVPDGALDNYQRMALILRY